MSADQDRSIVFLIPVRNPFDEKVSDYRTIETLLQRTVNSLLRQTCRNVLVIVACHRVPAWGANCDERVVFLDVSGSDVFAPDRNHRIIDKGLKYIIAALYAYSVTTPHLVMPMDADDYVNVTLGSHLLDRHFSQEARPEGYLVTRGVHVGISVQESSPRYEFAIVVRDFDHTCGTCRVLDAESLRKRLKKLSPVIEDRFSDWGMPDETRRVTVSREPIGWLDDITRDSRDQEASIVNLLGRHTNQQPYLNLVEADLIGAAKGCGHGNHEGPRGGAVHWHRQVSEMPIAEFVTTFGLPEQSHGSRTRDALHRAREADARAGRIWEDP